MDSRLFLLFVLFQAAASRSIIDSLPGFTGALPFILETGYVSVKESDDVHLFYYFIESEKDPLNDPILVWISGGPGCSSFSGLVYEIGPFVFNVPAFNGSLPSLLLNPFSWTKVANIIFLDAPVGSGFSYATNSEAYYSSDTKTARDTYDFLRKWLLDHPKFIRNPLYIGGDSYSGKVVPMVVFEISNGNEAGLTPRISVQGYVIGNPLTDPYNDLNSRIQYAHQMALIPNEYYEAAKSSCEGEYARPNPSNSECMKYLQLIKECTESINAEQILEPKCIEQPNPHEFRWGLRFFEDTSMDILVPFQETKPWCRSNSYLISPVWANDPSVQEALHIRKGSKAEWSRCNRSLAFDKDVLGVVHIHQFLSNKPYHSLVYSGDHDMVIPYIGTRAWIQSLNLTIDDYWKPWFVDGQVAGFIEKYKKEGFHLTFATVKLGLCIDVRANAGIDAQISPKKVHFPYRFFEVLLCCDFVLIWLDCVGLNCLD